MLNNLLCLSMSICTIGGFIEPFYQNFENYLSILPLTSEDISQPMLVNRTWRRASERLLYRNLVLNGGRPIVPLLRIIRDVGGYVQTLTIQHSRGNLVPLRGVEESRHFIACCPNIRTIYVTDADPLYILQTIIARPLGNLQCINIDWDNRTCTFGIRRHYFIATLKHSNTITEVFLPYPDTCPFFYVLWAPYRQSRIS